MLLPNLFARRCPEQFRLPPTRFLRIQALNLSNYILSAQTREPFPGFFVMTVGRALRARRPRYQSRPKPRTGLRARLKVGGRRSADILVRSNVPKTEPI